MSNCYAHELGNCYGMIENEHFIPVAIQEMLGTVQIAGFSWNDQSAKHFHPGSYAKSKMLCAYHHDELDGLDANARDYFQNWMLIAFQKNLATGKLGAIQDIHPVIDGRSLERWFLKTICGAIASGSFKNVTMIPLHWIKILFEHEPWPSQWALHIKQQTLIAQHEDASVRLDFHWSQSNLLNGLIFRAFTVETLFAIEPPNTNIEKLIQRPRILGAKVHRSDGRVVLEGLPNISNVEFQLSWPES